MIIWHFISNDYDMQNRLELKNQIGDKQNYYQINQHQKRIFA